MIYYRSIKVLGYLPVNRWGFLGLLLSKLQAAQMVSFAHI